MTVATARAQRIGIWIIAFVMLVGTIGSFLVIVLSSSNAKSDQVRLTELTTEYENQYKDYQAKVDAQATELSDKYFAEFNQYAGRPAAFDAASVTELKSEDLKVGEGEEITADSSFTAYYLGWNPTGKVFDGSIEGEKLKAPLSVVPGGVIEGWTKGVLGMKVGGVRELTIPAAQAYAEAGSGEDIPPNTPLKFVIFIIPTPTAIAQPQPSEELLRLYNSSNT